MRWKREDSQQRCRTKRPQLDIPTASQLNGTVPLLDEFTVIVPMGVDIGWPIDMVILLPGVGMLVATETSK